MQHDAPFAWLFIYGIAGTHPQPISPPSTGPSSLTSQFTASEVTGLDQLASGWQLSRVDTQKVATLGVAFLALL